MNENKFLGKANAYDKARPDYPQEAVDYILSLASGLTVADIGSGTGKLTGKLLERNCKVYAIEPNEEMRVIAEQRLSRYSDKFISVNAVAEQTSLANNSVDFITVAQALHWFDLEKFTLECKRILKPNGKIFIVYYETEGKIASKYYKFLSSHCNNVKGVSGGDSKEKIKQFFGAHYIKKTFNTEITYDLDTFIERSISSSYTPKMGDDNYNEFIRALTIFFNKNKKNDLITIRNITSVYYA